MAFEGESTLRKYPVGPINWKRRNGRGIDCTLYGVIIRKLVNVELKKCVSFAFKIIRFLYIHIKFCGEHFSTDSVG